MSASLPQLPPDEKYRVIAARFSEVVRGVTEWDAPTPVAEWHARDVVGHLVGWLSALVHAGSSFRFDDGPPVEADPRGALEVFDPQVQRLLTDPAAAEILHSNLHTGQDRPLPQVVDQVFTGDVFFHTWDLARASGQDDALDADLVHDALTSMSAMEEQLRPSGQFGQQQPVPADATEQERLFAFLGRDPRWTP
ncbi:TIGR03086 family protein [Brachybacterium vulturis]|uniref:TIGR03086 family protein n=1 Tax=Brachybacterium vulturis TaxID=2017484 RepID=A0A291GK98_9MICO|nr:TIGR03086 family metal-binding protein [Brachybacterium vulturis]ATG50769.1 TIGR03086 family protein [Brachybacterium vulturis]